MLKDGANPMSVFGEEFSDFSYCWYENETLWLSLIDVKREFRGKGVLTRLLEYLKKEYPKIIIPTPSKIVYQTALKCGYQYAKIPFVLPDGSSEMGEAMVYQSDSQGLNNQ